jgi:hypothetical protein
MSVEVLGFEFQGCMLQIVHRTKLLNLLTMSTFVDQARYFLPFYCSFCFLDSSGYRLWILLL